METTAAVPRPLRRDAELNRQRILTAAREVFADRGLEATLDDIARRAGLGVGTVYRRFPNKEALVDALFEEGFTQVVAATERALEKPDAWSATVELLTELAGMQSADRGLRDVMLTESYGNDRVARLRDRVKPLMEQLVERAQRQGGLRADLRAGDLPALLMMIATTVELGRDVRPEIWRRYLTVLLDGMCARRDGVAGLPEPVLDDDELRLAMQTWPGFRRVPRPAG